MEQATLRALEEWDMFADGDLMIGATGATV
jgi:hypothetical protein